MSLTSKIVLATATAVSAGIICYVHYKQEWDRKKLREGVMRDMERQHNRKSENLRNIEQQISLTKELQSQYTNDEANVT